MNQIRDTLQWNFGRRPQIFVCATNDLHGRLTEKAGRIYIAKMRSNQYTIATNSITNQKTLINSRFTPCTAFTY